MIERGSGCGQGIWGFYGVYARFIGCLWGFLGVLMSFLEVPLIKEGVGKGMWIGYGSNWGEIVSFRVRMGEG